MTCPTCNIEMNHHAEKPVDPRSPEEAALAEATGLLIEEVHCCPGCGCTGSERKTG